jgi:hypothetical protein
MNRRMLIMLVIALGLCWLAIVSASIAGGPSFAGRLDMNARVAQQLRSRFTARLPISQLRLVSGDPETCLLEAGRMAVPEAGVCSYSIQPDPGKTRRLSLLPGMGSRSVRLVLEQPEYLQVEEVLKHGDSIDLDIFDSKLDSTLTFSECVLTPSENEASVDASNGCMLEIPQ